MELARRNRLDLWGFMKTIERNRELASFPLWTPLWTLGLLFTWLLPNHYRPWTSFHSEAWGAVMVTLMLIGVGIRSRQAFNLDWISLLFLGLGTVVWLQFAARFLPFAGQAWVMSGFFALGALTVIGTAQWERFAPGQAMDALFAAIGVAALLSVGLQLDQWLQTELLEIWNMGADGVRSYANFGQPNLLSTFLVWGLLSVLWAAHRGHFGAVVSTICAMFLLFGIALTQSRTGWLCLIVLVLAILLWRRHWRWHGIPLVALMLALWLGLCVWGLKEVSIALQVQPPPQLEGRLAVGGDLRFIAWKLLFESSMERPFLGFGMGNIYLAQIEAPVHSTAVFFPFGAAHNLFLDLVLSMGWPLGLLMLATVLHWLWARGRRVSDASQSILVLMVAVVGVHAMLELPLHHANFFLPVCMVIGVLNVRHAIGEGFRLPLWLYRTLSAVALSLLTLLVADYLRVETSLYRLRFEWNRVGTETRGSPPDVVLLTQLREWIRFLRFEPTTNMDQSQLQWMRDVTMVFPAPAAFLNLAKALALNGQPQEAALRLRQMCNISEARQCNSIRRVWLNDATKVPEFALVDWPTSVKD